MKPPELICNLSIGRAFKWKRQLGIDLEPMIGTADVNVLCDEFRDTVNNLLAKYYMDRIDKWKPE